MADDEITPLQSPSETYRANKHIKNLVQKPSHIGVVNERQTFATTAVNSGGASDMSESEVA